MLAEVATTELSKGQQPEGFAENKEVAQRGGRIAGQAREAIEADSGQPVITSQNAAQLNAVVTQMIETIAAAQPDELPPSIEDKITED